MKIAVVILNWNGKELLEKFLPSVITNSPEATIYVADNASTDDSIAFVKNRYPEIQIIRNHENGGYAKGYNDALKQVDADIFVLLNSDVEVTKNWIHPILSAFEENPDMAAAQPKILDFNKKDTFEYAGAAGGFIDKYAFPYCRGRIFDTLEKDVGQYDDNAQIFWASGACLFIRSKDFWEVNGFDEDYFAHQEEIDLCWRLNARGRKVYCIGASKVYHVGGGTLNSASPQKAFLNYRNSLFNLYKNRKNQIFGTLLVRLILDGVSGIFYLLKGKPAFTWQIIRSHFSFYLNLPGMSKKRKNEASGHVYFNVQNIPYQYFIKKTRYFNDL